MLYQCNACGTLVYRSASRVRLSGRVFCTYECSRQFDRTTMELSPMTRLMLDSIRVGNCVLWTGRTCQDGYGRLSYQNREWRAHALAYTLFRGPIPKGMVVMHACNTRTCIWPPHLSLGTPAQNTAYRDKCQRQSRGATHPKAKLTETLVREVRELAALGVPIRALAREYGTGYPAMRNAIQGRTWKHV